MKTATAAKPKSAFTESGHGEDYRLSSQEIQELYLADDVPWIVGYSGGKDSTAVLQLAWLAIADLPPEKRHKPIHVITTDTLVENPSCRYMGGTFSVRNARGSHRGANAIYSELAATASRGILLG